MTDIVERLRRFGPEWTAKYTSSGDLIPFDICVEAADEIERLRTALTQIAEEDDDVDLRIIARRALERPDFAGQAHMGIDPKCYELAEHFLQEHVRQESRGSYQECLNDLAGDIQGAVQAWFTKL